MRHCLRLGNRGRHLGVHGCGGGVIEIDRSRRGHQVSLAGRVGSVFGVLALGGNANPIACAPGLYASYKPPA